MVTIDNGVKGLPDISNRALRNFQAVTVVGTVVIDGFKMGLNLKTMWDAYEIDERNASNANAEKVKVG